jgi:GT2 family glycosyltransferase
MSAAALVTIAIPAFKPHYFAEALASALEQTYRPLEIVVGDDCPDAAIATLVGSCQALAQARGIALRHIRHAAPLGEVGNLARVVECAEGLYIKPLHDDDVLHPEAVARLVAVLHEHPRVALASSVRERIDATGAPLPATLQTAQAFTEDVCIGGPALVSWLAEHSHNFIGEPSCILARRADLLALGDGLMSLGGCLIHWFGDLALYANLLQNGDLALLATPLCAVRVSHEQFSQQGRDTPGIGRDGLDDLRRHLRELGWQRPGDDPRRLPVAPLATPAQSVEVDLPGLLSAAFARVSTDLEVRQWAACRIPDEVQQAQIDDYLRAHSGGPALAVMILHDGLDSAGLALTLASLETARRLYPPLTWSVLAHRCPLARAHALNQALHGDTSAWLMLASSGDAFTPAGLLLAGLELVAEPPCRALYGDALTRLANTQLRTALRPDFNLDYLLSCPQAMASHWLFRRTAVVQAGGFDVEYPLALEWALILRLLDREGPVGLGHVPEPWVIVPAAEAGTEPARGIAAQREAQYRRALLGHLHGRGYTAAQVHGSAAGQYAIDYGHADSASVSMLLVLDDDLPALQRCLASLVEQAASSPWEVLVGVGPAADDAARSWLNEVAQLLGERLRVVPVGDPRQRSAALNRLATLARGDYLLLLRSAVAVLDPHWLGALLNHAQRPEVGIVGALTVAADATVSHAGLLLGLDGAAASAFARQPLAASSYQRRLQVEQNYSAVADACLMIRGAIFQAVGGLRASDFSDQGADIDLCLRVAEQGYLTVWTPRACLLHNPPANAFDATLRQRLYQRWLPRLAHDPAHNPNLSLHRPGGFELADPALTWRPLTWRPLPVVLAQPADLRGCGHYRIIQPLHGLRRAGLIEGAVGAGLSLLDLQRYDPDVIVLQRQVAAEQLTALAEAKRFSRAFKVFELDDYLPRLPMKSLHRAHMPKDILRSIRRALACVDRFVVSTESLAAAFEGLHGDIRVMPNRLDPLWWGDLPVPAPRADGKPRVGWAGGAGHTGDLEMIADVVKALAAEVDWVFFGLCPAALRPYIKEIHPGVPLPEYPAALARLDLDLALAPLEQNLFNDCKSNLRLLEYGICGYPVVCSDVLCYQGSLPVTRVRNRFQDWVAAIRAQLADRPANARAGQVLRNAVRKDWMLEGEPLREWLRAWLPD